MAGFHLAAGIVPESELENVRRDTLFTEEGSGQNFLPKDAVMIDAMDHGGNDSMDDDRDLHARNDSIDGMNDSTYAV